MTRLCIAFARNLFLPEDLGGNRYPTAVVERLVARGHAVTVVTGRTPRIAARRGDELRVRSYPVSHRAPLLTHLTNIAMPVPMLLATLRQRPNVLLTSSYDIALPASAMARALGVPVVFTYHSEHYSEWAVALSRSPRLSARWLGRTVRRYMEGVQTVVLRASTRVIAVSRFSAEQIERSVPGIGGRIRLVPTGVDTARFRPAEDRFAARLAVGLDAPRPLLVAVGRLVPVKGFDLLIHAMGILRDRGVDAQLVIVGDGPESLTLRAAADSEQLGDRVRFAGYQSADGVAAYQRAADLQVCSSHFENHSLAIVEAFACGTPVAATPTGGTPDLVGALDPSLLFREVSPMAIADGLDRLLRERERLTAIGRRARALAVDRYDWDRVADGVEAVLLEVAVP